MKKRSIDELAVVSKEILHMKFKDNDTLQECFEQFVNLMKEHNIMRHTKDEAGRVTCANPEWIIFQIAFYDKFKDFFTWKFLMIEPDETNTVEYKVIKSIETSLKK